MRKTILVMISMILFGLIISNYNSIDNKKPNDFVWNNNWNNNTEINQAIPEENKPEISTQLTANSWDEAVKLSGEKGKPILTLFTSDSCPYCTQFKENVLPNKEVKNLMLNYIFIIEDTTNNEGQRIARKFNLRYIPSIVITNSKEEKLKFAEKYMGVEQFVQWLDNPGLYQQPLIKDLPEIKIEPRVEPEPEPEPQRRWPRCR